MKVKVNVFSDNKLKKAEVDFIVPPADIPLSVSVKNSELTVNFDVMKK